MKRPAKLGEATINGKQVSFFSPPHDEPDFPWVDTLELAKAFLPTAKAKQIVEMTLRFSKGPSATATARNEGRIATIMCHAMAHGLTMMIDQKNGHSADDDEGPAFREYSLQAGRFTADHWPLSFDDMFHAFQNPGGPFMRNAVI